METLTGKIISGKAQGFTNRKASDLFEGANSSLKQAYDNAVEPMNYIEKQLEEFDNKLNSFGSAFENAKDNLPDDLEELEIERSAVKDFLTKALTGLVEELEGKLPEEKQYNPIMDKKSELFYSSVGWNDCLKEIKKRLTI